MAKTEGRSSNRVAQGRDGGPGGQPALAEHFAKRISVSELMAENWGESSNSVYEVLADWEAQLKHADIDFEELGL